MDSLLTLNSAYDVQQSLAEAVRIRRKQKKWSRQELAERSGVPAATIKHFESTGQISLRQFLLLWQLLDSLDTILELT
ncbi:MAG TPA: helix-turn-helix transcriptional regulator, partial [Agitococcus sp.]|nr:helix-turn-helix transcriptional regulator [Agitococcus sp.]